MEIGVIATGVASPVTLGTICPIMRMGRNGQRSEVLRTRFLLNGIFYFLLIIARRIFPRLPSRRPEIFPQKPPCRVCSSDRRAITGYNHGYPTRRLNHYPCNR